MLIILGLLGILIANIVLCANGFAASWIMVFFCLGALLLVAIIDFISNHVQFIPLEDVAALADEDLDILFKTSKLSKSLINLVSMMSDEDIEKIRERYKDRPQYLEVLNKAIEEANKKNDKDG